MAPNGGPPLGKAGLRGSVAYLEATGAKARDVVPRYHDHQRKQDPGEFKLRQVLHDAHEPRVADPRRRLSHASAGSVSLRDAQDAEAVCIVLMIDTWRDPGAEPETGHSATPRPCGLTNGSM
jgi:hypothetical protein